MNANTPFIPASTVYGTLLNFTPERAVWAQRMQQAPYNAPPQAPMLYVKTANTFSPSLWCGQGVQTQPTPIALPADVPEVDVGATLGLVIQNFERNVALPLDENGFSATSMDASMLAGVALFNDIAVPHVSYYRPPVKFNCRDGFLGIGPQCLPLDRVGPLHELVLQVHINGELRQTVALADLFRPAAPLLADVSAFMTLQPGDVLLLGTSCLTTPGQEGTRPRARVGDTVTVSAPGFAPLVNTFVAEGAA